MRSQKLTGKLPLGVFLQHLNDFGAVFFQFVFGDAVYLQQFFRLAGEFLCVGESTVETLLNRFMQRFCGF